MKKTILTAITILSVFGLSACGNVQNADKEVSGVTTTTSANVVTTVTTPSASTTVDEVTTTPSNSDTAVTTEPTTKTETTTTPIVTTSATETTTVATSKATTTTTKKATTTTKKATTTTAKKTTTTAPKKTEKVTTTTTAEKKVQLTQSDIDRLVKELQEYSDSIGYENIYQSVANSKKYKDKSEEEILTRVQEHFDVAYKMTPENGSSWTCPVHIIQDVDTYEEAYQYVKNAIDYDYECFDDAHLVLYARWCPNGEGSTNTCETRDCWDIYTLR